ncbi:MAG: hypothetical protein QF430_04365 [Candidatus Marinimicrobia bacterium]|nr:hypothetical protein [Candidatus Neomarinimicrobiota bacterium]
MKCFVSIAAPFVILLGSVFPQEAMSLRFFASESDFIAGNTMPASARHKKPHLEIAYNEKGRPRLKSNVNASGSVVSQEMYSYSYDGSLQKKAVLDEKQRITELARYGKDEAWSSEFRKYTAPVHSSFAVIGQESVFTIGIEGQIHSVEFRTIDNVSYGRIDFRYDHLGFLSEELWRTLPDRSLVRRFKYKYDLMTEKNQIWEYGKGGTLVSHMTLAKAPADQLYKTAFPRTGNTLDEVDLIIEDLLKNRVQPNIAAYIPKMDWDRIRLLNGEDYMADVVNVIGDEILFRLPQDLSLYRIPVSRVESVISRNGDYLYP